MAISARKRVEGEESAHYVSPRKKRERPPPKLQPPMTPMIDVVFQLLLFFLLGSTFRQAEGQIPGTLPAEMGVAATDKPQEKDITIKIVPRGSDGMQVSYELTGTNIAMSDPKELYEALVQRQRAIRSNEAPLIIDPSQGVRWKFVVEAYNQAVRAQFKNVGFATAG